MKKYMIDGRIVAFEAQWRAYGGVWATRDERFAAITKEVE